jgi:hypothetical protein
MILVQLFDTLGGAVKALSLPRREGEGKMLRTVAKKVAWVGRPASTVFGLALVMALSSCGSRSQETKIRACRRVGSLSSALLKSLFTGVRGAGILGSPTSA